jgi:hypothetical protein
MANEKKNNPCKPGVDCSYTVRRHKIICTGGAPPDCFRAELLEANKSAFHTDQIADATQAINKILSEIPKDSEGRMPAFIQTRMGIMLAWVEHEDEDARAADKDEVGVTSADDNDTLAKALNLKNYNSKPEETE